MKAPLRRPVSVEHPLLILMANAASNSHLGPSQYDGNARAVVEHWHSLDDLLKAHATVQIEGICDDQWRRCEVLLPAAQEAGVPIVLQTQTNNADVNDTMPLDMARRLLDRYDCIVGLQLSEASQRTFVAHGAGPEYSMGRNARYARDVIRLAGEYGLFMSWQLMSENYAAVGCSRDNEALFDTVAEYGEYVIPMHEMNSEFAKYIDHLAAMGLWASGTTANWGVEGQSWYWSDAGYAAPGTFLPGSLEMPGELYAIMFLLGATAGATAYSIEPPWDIWPGESGRHRFTDWIAPTFSRLVAERLIPARDEVLESTPLAYRLRPCERPVDFHRVSADLDFDHGEGRLIRATYGVFDRARDAEMIPNSPRYGWIPVLPARTSDAALSEFQRVIRPGEIGSVEDAASVADECFPPCDRGTAWSSVVGPLIVAANTHESWYVPEAAKLDLPARPVDVRVSEEAVSWTRRAGDRGFRVWRLREGLESCLTPEPIDDDRLATVDYLAGDRYAVSAITDERETFQETLHLHQFVIFSARESRRSPWVGADGVEMPSDRFAENVADASPEVLDAERRCAECTPVEDLGSPEVAGDDPHRAVKLDVMETMAEWKHAIEDENIDAAEALYAPSYREPDGRTVESVGTALRSVLQGHVVAAMDRLEREWGLKPAWQFPVVRLFVRDWVEATSDRVIVDVACEMWAGGGPELEPSDMFKHPLGADAKRMRMTWERTPDGWKIAATDPPFIRMEQVVVFRMRYQGW